MNPAQSAIKRTHRMLGREFEVLNFTYDADGGANAYADGSWISDDIVRVVGTIDFPGSDRSTTRSASGTDVEGDAIIYLIPGEVTVINDPGVTSTSGVDEVTIRRGTESETRASELRDTVSGKSYTVVDTDRHQSIVAVHVEES